MHCYTANANGVFPGILTSEAGLTPGVDDTIDALPTIAVGDKLVQVVEAADERIIKYARVGRRDAGSGGTDMEMFVIPLHASEEDDADNMDDRVLILVEISGGINPHGNSAINVRKGSSKADVGACDDVVVVARGRGQHGIHVKHGRFDAALLIVPPEAVLDIDRSGTLYKDSEQVTILFPAGEWPVIQPAPTVAVEAAPGPPTSGDLETV